MATESKDHSVREGRVLLASIPRCGSTYLFRSLAGLPEGERFPFDIRCDFVRDPNCLPTKPFLKTHGLAPDSLPEGTRAVFLFGDPINAVVSTRRHRYNSAHFRNCGYESCVPPNIYRSDVLGYERMFDSWMQAHTYPMLALRYETLHEHEAALSGFLDFEVRLPPFRSRSTCYPIWLRLWLNQVYGRLKRKVESAPDAAIYNVNA